MILDKFPSAEDFYKNYWGKKPFIVRGAISADVIDGLIDGDSLAGLSLEEEVRSRIVTTAPDGGEWGCEHGPFDEEKFSTLGDAGWSLLVQNVEQYHTDTANLLQHFNFSPRWLMDDIMVSYSEKGGSVGPHTDSYHVFLVQGIGKRQWKIARTALDVDSAEYVDSQELIILKDSFDGIEVEMSLGDVLYIPPHFAHEGVTTQSAMTFSVGFLGPKLSDMMVAYGHYLEQCEVSRLDDRYSGQGLDGSSAAFTIDGGTRDVVRDGLVGMLHSDDFSRWMVEYFSAPSHEEVQDIEAREEQLSANDLLGHLQSGGVLVRPEHVKLAIVTSGDGSINLAAFGKIVPVPKAFEGFISWLSDSRLISMADIDGLGDRGDLMKVVTYIYNKNILEKA